MSGPSKQFDDVIIIPISKEVKAELKERAGRLNMAELVRGLIAQYLESAQIVDNDQTKKEFGNGN